MIFGPLDDAAVGRWVREHQAVEWCDDAGLPLRYGEVGHANDHVAMVGRYRAAALAHQPTSPNPVVSIGVP